MMETKIASVKEAVATLTGRANVSGDTAFFKMRNAELTVQLSAAKQQASRFQAELKQSQKLINELETEVRRISFGHSCEGERKKAQRGYENPQ